MITLDVQSFVHGIDISEVGPNVRISEIWFHHGLERDEEVGVRQRFQPISRPVHLVLILLTLG